MELRQAFFAQKRFLYHAMFFSMVIGVLTLSPSVYMLEVYGRVVNSRNIVTLLMLTLLLAMAYGILEFLQWARQGLLRQAATGFDRILAERIYEAVFQANLHGDPNGARALRDFGTVREFIGSAIFAGLMDIPMALVLIGVIFWIDITLGWFTLASAVVQAGITLLNKRATEPGLNKANRLSAQSRVFMEATLKNSEIVQAMGMTQNLRRRWLKIQKELLFHQVTASDRAGIYTTLSKYVQLVASSLVLGLGAWMVLNQKFSGDFGWMLMASILAGRALAPLVQAIARWRNVADAREACRRLTHLLEEISASVPALPLPPPKGELRVQQVSAAAPGTNLSVLRNITFQAPQGKILGIIGPSASGKSSLAHVLVGVWPCLSGTVRLDGVDIHLWNKQELGPYLGFLPQQVALFEGTVAENIARFGIPDHEKTEAAAHLTGLHELILSLPQGYDTEIGAEGCVLSGGFRQRIGLARALYGNPRLIVLDEPNANLDEAGDAALDATLLALRAKGATIVVITHRKSLLVTTDFLLLLAEGEVKLFGTKEEVLKKLGIF
jgi:ATP-binding cassette subfamily C exporter for protease/lipase